MLIQFFPNGKGGGAGPVNYLTNREVLAYDENRDLIRDEHGQPQIKIRAPLPEVLRGDPQRMIDLIDASQHQWSYRAGVVSFERDDAPTDDQQQAAIDAFEELAFAGLDGERYDMLWVRHTHEDRVELHFCTPRMELVTGRSLNIAPPGYERAYDTLRDVLNKQYGWADPMDPARVQEVQRPVESIERAQSREVVQDWIIDQISEGLIYDRAGLVSACESAGFVIPRAGKNYITVQDPETGARFRMKGEIFHENWKASDSLEQTAEREHGAAARRSSRLDAIPDGELSARLAEHIRRRAQYHAERYPETPGAELRRDPRQQQADREQHGLDYRVELDGAETRGADRRPSPSIDEHGELDSRVDHNPAPDVVDFLGAGSGDEPGRPGVGDRWGSGGADDMSAIGPPTALFDQKGLGYDDWSHAVRARVAELRERAHASLRAIGSGVARLRSALDQSDGRTAECHRGWHDTFDRLTAGTHRGVKWVHERVQDLRRVGRSFAAEQAGVERDRSAAEARLSSITHQEKGLEHE